MYVTNDLQTYIYKWFISMSKLSECSLFLKYNDMLYILPENTIIEWCDSQNEWLRMECAWKLGLAFIYVPNRSNVCWKT